MDYFRLVGISVSPDNTKVAFGVDTFSRRQYTIKIKDLESGKKWPVVVFSHGIGCSRTMYSQVCYDMASYGMIVAATEHREGSACMSCYYSSTPENDTNDINWVEHYKCELSEDEYALRNRQVHLRSKEASRTLDVLIGLNNGENLQNVYKKHSFLLFL